MITDALAAGDDSPLTLLFGVRNPEDQLYRDELEALAAGVRKDLKILSGWRFDEFGRDAVDLVEGRIGFAIEHGKLKLSRMVEEPVDA